MTFFEQELRKLFNHNVLFADTQFVGNTCYGRLTDNIRVKIHFQTGGVADNYDRLKVTVLNRNEGPIDCMTICFKDLWCVKNTASPNLRKERGPYICDYYEKPEWYVYQPTKADYKQLAEAVGTYLSMFQEPVQEQQMGQTQTM